MRTTKSTTRKATTITKDAKVKHPYNVNVDDVNVENDHEDYKNDNKNDVYDANNNLHNDRKDHYSTNRKRGSEVYCMI